jgi:hypothetical protein
LIDLGGQMLSDTLEDIDKIFIWIDLVQPARGDQRLDYADMLGTEFGPTEQPGFPTHWNQVQRTFKAVGVDRYIRVGQKDFKGRSAFLGISQWRLESKVLSPKTLFSPDFFSFVLLQPVYSKSDKVGLNGVAYADW